MAVEKKGLIKTAKCVAVSRQQKILNLSQFLPLAYSPPFPISTCKSFSFYLKWTFICELFSKVQKWWLPKRVMETSGRIGAMGCSVGQEFDVGFLTSAETHLGFEMKNQMRDEVSLHQMFLHALLGYSINFNCG